MYGSQRGRVDVERGAREIQAACRQDIGSARPPASCLCWAHWCMAWALLGAFQLTRGVLHGEREMHREKRRSVVKHGIRPTWGALVSASLLAGNVGRVGEPSSCPIQDGSTKFPTWGGFLSKKGRGESFQPWGVGCGWAGGRGAGHDPAAAQLHNLLQQKEKDLVLSPALLLAPSALQQGTSLLWLPLDRGLGGERRR